MALLIISFCIMDFANENKIFDSFICHVQDCTNQISNNSTILSCFHSICSAHIQAGNVGNCTEELCYSYSQNNPNYVSLPAQQHRCVNVVNTQLANQLLCLYNTRLRGAIDFHLKTFERIYLSLSYEIASQIYKAQVPFLLQKI